MESARASYQVFGECDHEQVMNACYYSRIRYDSTARRLAESSRGRLYLGLCSTDLGIATVRETSSRTSSCHLYPRSLDIRGLWV